MKKPALVFPSVFAFGALIFTAGLADMRKEGRIEIEKCQTIDQPGSYKLVNNLVSPGGGSADCLAITADFVTIDLADFNISAASLTGGSGIAARPSSGSLAGVVVRNGSISTFGAGVDLSKASDSIVEGVRVSGGCGRLCGLGISATGIVKGNSVFGIEGAGISATGVVSGNYAVQTFAGFIIGQGSTVIGNTASDNVNRGFIVNCPSNVTDNTAVNNGGNLELIGEGCNNTNNVAP